MQSTMTVPSEGPGGTPRNLQVEAKLAEWRLHFEFIEECPVEQITIDQDAQVRAGVNIAPRESVDEYMAQMRNGAKFPPIVLSEHGGLLDGNTRLAAARRLRREALPAYRVTCGTPEMAVMLAAALNMMGGKRLTTAEAAEAAQVMMAQGFPDAAIARELGRDPSSVRRWKAQQDSMRRALSLGLNVQSLPKVMLEKLASVRREEPFRELACLVLDAGLRKPAELTALVDEVNQAPSDEVAVRKIAERRAELAPAGPPPGRANVRKEVQIARMAIGNLLKHADNPAALAATPSDVERWQQIATLAAAVLAAAQEQTAA